MSVYVCVCARTWCVCVCVGVCECVCGCVCVCALIALCAVGHLLGVFSCLPAFRIVDDGLLAKMEYHYSTSSLLVRGIV